MKKILMTIVAIFATMTMFTLTSCSSDDDTVSSGSIVGDWATMQIESSGTFMIMEYLNFASNGTVTGMDYEVTGQDLNGNAVISSIEKSTFSGTYSASDGNLTMTIDGQTRQMTYKATATDLTIVSSQGTFEYDKVDSNIQQISNNVEQLYQAQGNQVYY